MMNELRQTTIVGLHVCLTCADELAFEPERTKIEGHLALLRQLILRTRVFWHEHTHDAYATGSLG
ncbi:hypothetical protein D3C81_2163930 [compost metagenome]